MPADWSRRLAVAVTTVGVAASLATIPTASFATEPAEPVYSFVSAPDLFNADLGDLRQLDTWRQSYGNSTSPHMRDSIATVFGAMAAEPGSDVLVVGDLVEGHWGADVESTRMFGRVSTRDARRRQIRRVGHFYYSEWKERFANRGLTVYPAIGDHEIGDNPWSGTKAAYGAGNVFKRRAFGVYKETWADVFAGIPGFVSRPVRTPYEDTAYAIHPHPDVLVVTLDVFRRGGGDVHVSLSARQLAWLDQTLSESTAQTKIVQGHTPILGPVNKEYSSGLMYEGGASSALWRTLVEHDVDLYLCGEVHTVSALEDQGVTQISHGGLIHRGRANYLTADVYADGSVELAVKRFDATVDDSRNAPRLWATTYKRPFTDVVYQPDPHVTGTMTLDAAGVAVATGELAPGGVS